MKTQIRTGKLSGRLPGVRILANVFGVNPATVSKALHVLQEKGYVTIVPGSGAFVLPQPKHSGHRTLGVICSRSSVTVAQMESYYRNSRYHYSPYSVSQITEMIDGIARKYGFHAVLIRPGREQLHENPRFLAELPLDGMIFLYSSLHYATAELLRKKHIPFISTNACYGIPEVNFIDFNVFEAVNQFVSESKARGISRIGFFNLWDRFGLNDRIYSMFRKKLGKTFRPEFFVSETRYRGTAYETRLDKIAGSAWGTMRSKGKIPEIIICSADLAGPLEDAIQESGLRVKADVKLAIITQDSRQICSAAIAADAADLYRRATARLVAMVEEDDDSIVQQWLNPRIIWHENVQLNHTIMEVNQ